MSVSESLIAWLKTFNNTQTINKVDTDIQSDTALTYALIKEPIVNEKHYLSGLTERTEHYQVSARLNTQTDTARVKNGLWLENLEAWIREQNRTDNLPTITGASVKSVEVTSAFYLGETSENTSVYSLTIAIKYTI